MSQQAFDTLAPGYDRAFTDSPIARHLRARVHAHLLSYAPAESSILELGCGTGEDACYLGERGYNVMALDGSPAMLEIARAKCAGHKQVRFDLLDLNGELPTWPDPPGFTLAFANFGVLNCVRDVSRLSRWLAAQLLPGGVAAFGVMAPFCLWEMGWHVVHGEFATAFRRLNSQVTFQPDASAPPIPLLYPSVGKLTAAFTEQYECVNAEPLGVFLPPSDVYGAVEQRPRLLQLLLRLDSSIGRSAWLANAADHYWIAFRRR